MVTLPFETDHIYAFPTENKNSRDSPLEILKKLIISETGLLLRLQEQLPEKDRKIKSLEEENKKLRALLQKKASKTDEAIFNFNDHANPVELRSVATSPIPPELLDSLVEYPILTTSTRYHIIQEYNSLHLEDDQEHEETFIEVPRWRRSPKMPSTHIEGTEPLDDDTFNNRHLKLEKEERKIKKRDRQKIREELHREHLLGRKRNRNKANEYGIDSLFPHPMKIRAIEVTDSIPVVAFGAPVPLLSQCEFSLPWLNKRTRFGS